MVQIRVDKRAYSNDWTLGRIDNQTTIAFYSVTDKRQILNDHSNARYLIDDAQIKPPFDLTIDHCKFIPKDPDVMANEPTLQTLCHWALSQDGRRTAKEVFGGADFATWRGTLKRIANTLISYNPRKRHPEDAWRVIAQKVDGVILISEQNRRFENDTEIGTYSGFKFEQYMTANTPGGDPDTSAAVDIRPTFEMMVTSELVVGAESLKLCCGAEVDALRGDVPVELKTSPFENDERFFHNVKTVMQSEIVGVSSLVIGIKQNYIVYKVIETTIDDIKTKGEVGKNVKQGYAFLFKVLQTVKTFLETNEACDVFFDPSRGVVEITVMSRQDANANGKGVSDEFLNRFHV